jgi:hypothetical protein
LALAWVPVATSNLTTPWAVALALLGDDVDQDRPGLGVAHVAQHREQVVDVVAVDRADVIEAEILEQRAAAHHHAAGILLGERGAVLDQLGQVLAELLADVAQRPVGAARPQLRQIGRHGADRRRDRHVVVVEDDDQAGIHGAGVVHRLVGHAGRHGAVAYHRDDVAVLHLLVARDRHAERGRDRGRRMGGAERVVLALRPLGEAGQAAALAQRADAVAPAGDDLVRIGLVADVPDQPVGRGVEHIVQRNGELDHAEPGAEVAAGHRDGIDHLQAELVGELAQVGGIELAQVDRRVDLVKQRRLRRRLGQ